MYAIKVLSKYEIRMGSPYSACKLEISGGFLPSEMQNREFQDCFAISSDGETAFISDWQINEQNADPGFRIIKLDNKKKTLEISATFDGICEEIRPMNDQAIEVLVWKHQQPEKSIRIDQWPKSKLNES